METLQWAIGVVVVMQMGVMGWFATQLSAHLAECRHISAQLEGLVRDVERMKTDIGTHETGMRGSIHKANTMCTAHELRLTILERP